MAPTASVLTLWEGRVQDSLSALAANDATTGSGVSQRFTYADLAVYDAKSQRVTQQFGSCAAWSALLGSDLAIAKFSYYPLALQLISMYDPVRNDYDLSHAVQTDVFCRDADKVAEIVDALTAQSMGNAPRIGENASQINCDGNRWMVKRCSAAFALPSI
jgi:hypothetical protein